MAGQRPRGFKVTETGTSAQGSDSSSNRKTAKESSERVVAAAEVQKRRREASGTPSDSERMAVIQAQLEKRQRREPSASLETKLADLRALHEEINLRPELRQEEEKELRASHRGQQFEEELSLFGSREQIDQQIARGMARFDQQARRQEVPSAPPQTAETSSRRQQFEEGLSLFGSREQIDQQIARGMARFDQQATNPNDDKREG